MQKPDSRTLRIYLQMHIKKGQADSQEDNAMKAIGYYEPLASRVH
jgi:hypothetical protein